MMIIEQEQINDENNNPQLRLKRIEREEVTKRNPASLSPRKTFGSLGSPSPQILCNELVFLDLSIINIHLTSCLQYPQKITCAIQGEANERQITSLVTSFDGKYFFPKESIQYIRKMSTNQIDVLFQFRDCEENLIGQTLYQLNPLLFRSNRTTLPIVDGESDIAVGQVTILPKIKEEVSKLFISCSFVRGIL
jgi:hypothetical protein